ERLTDAYLIHYTSIAKFKALNDVPMTVRRLVRRALSNVARKLLANLVRQDVLMIEEEQQAFDENPLRQPVEVNRTILRVQQLVRSQAAKEQGR
ncbi:MAG TPA: aromatic ring-hydroxylating dioxygenase subunit alpha, partial [Candidatus Limnocylindria bacterium]|nr:aromatic ring-hydroxylating dioxygenase subunit alpha [Candidatus Limnocylindria bacterium]